MIYKIGYTPYVFTKSISFAGESQKISPELWAAIENTKTTLDRMKEEIDIGFSGETVDVDLDKFDYKPHFTVDFPDKNLKLVVNEALPSGYRTTPVNVIRMYIKDSAEKMIVGYVPVVCEDVADEGKTYKKGDFINSVGDTPENQKLLIDCLTKANKKVNSTLNNVYSREAKESGKIDW